jgi:hypothetical protein
MGLFSGIFSSLNDFFTGTPSTDVATSESHQSSSSSDSSSTPTMTEHSCGNSSSSSDTSDVFSAWGTATPNEICAESCSISHSNSFTDITYGSIDTGISCSSSFDTGSSFTSSFDS